MAAPFHKSIKNGGWIYKHFAVCYQIKAKRFALT